MARRVLVGRAPLVFPEVDRTYLLEVFQQELKAGRQCHPRLKSIQNGHALFESELKVQYTPKCKIGYRLICRVPLTDPYFQTEKDVEWLYYTQAAPYVIFRPESYYDNQGYGIAGPN